jgi:hypothetical protein
MRKSGLELELESRQATTGRASSSPLPRALMATTGMRHTHVRLLGTTVLITLSMVCLLERVRGFAATTVTATMVVATMADGAATTVAVGKGAMTDSAVGVDIVAMGDGMAAMDSAEMRASTAVEDSRVVEDSRAAGSEAVTGLMVAAGSMEAAMVAGSTAAVASMEAGPAVAAGRMEGATGSR